jgi:hypothetical protein
MIQDFKEISQTPIPIEESSQARQPGFAEDLLAGIDTEALLAAPIDELFAEYTPEDRHSMNIPVAAPRPRTP